MQIRRGLITIMGLTLASTVYAADPTVNPDADNSAKNQIHNGTDAKSADQQSNDKGDVELTRKIRQALTGDKSLSTYARNVKIITNNGEVVLKGPVKDSKEKQIVEDQAARVAGADKVRSEIEVTAK